MRTLYRIINRFFSFVLIVSLLFNPVSPAFALRVQQPVNSSIRQPLESGLEEVSIEPIDEKVVADHWRRMVEILNEIPTVEGSKRTVSQFAPDRRDPRFSFVARQRIRGADGKISEGPVIGLVVGQPLEQFPGAVYVNWLGVHQGKQDWRQKGIGRRLMEKVFAAAKEAGYWRVTWHTAEWNEEARRFYESMEGVRLVSFPLAVLPKGERLFRYEITLKGSPASPAPAAFHPSARSPQVLIRAGPKQPLADYPLEIARHLHQVMAPFFQEELRQYGFQETPLVPLPGVSRAMGKPVYLLREALLPTGSSKPRMLAALFDLYLNKDPYHLTNRGGKRPPSRWGTQSTGNHLLAMAWGGHELKKELGYSEDLLQVLGFTMAGIPAAKKSQAEELGAEVRDKYGNYEKARQAMEETAAAEGDDFIHWRHGDRPVILGNMATAIQLQEQIERDHPDWLGRRFAVISATGAGGRIAGLSAGLTRLFGSNVKVIGAETAEVPPLFKAVEAGVPVPIPLPPRRVAVDGIAVDRAEEEALNVVLKAADAVALVEEEADAIPFTKWLARDLQKAGWAPDLAKTEVVTGMSLSVPFKYPWLVEDVDVVIIDETGRNIDPADWQRVVSSGLPPQAAGLEEEYHPDDLGAVLSRAAGIRRASPLEPWIGPQQRGPSRLDRFVSWDGLVEFVRDGDGLVIALRSEDRQVAFRLEDRQRWYPGNKSGRSLAVDVRKPDGSVKRHEKEDPKNDLPWIQGIRYERDKKGRSRLILALDSRWVEIEPENPFPLELSAPAFPVTRAGSHPPSTVQILFDEEEILSGSSPVRWIGDLENVRLIPGDPGPVFLPFHLNLRQGDPDALNGSLELALVVEGRGERAEFPIPERKRRLFDGRHGPHRNNHRFGAELPDELRPFLAQGGIFDYSFKYRLKGETRWRDTSWLPPEERGVGEIVSHPDWLFQGAVYTINVKAWGGFEAASGFEQVRRRLPDLERLGARVLLLQGIHPGHTAFEIDDFEGVDPKLGSRPESAEAEFNALVAEAKSRGFRLLIPFVPNHASPHNRLLQERPRLFFQGWLHPPAEKTVTVDVQGSPATFWRGNVYNEKHPRGEEPKGFGPGTVQFNLWDPQIRRELSDYWVQVLGRWTERGIDGFYADTGHSIHSLAPGWLEGIQRRVQREHPGTVFGYEAHWQQAEGFVRRGGSFAQEHALYHDWLRELVYGRKDAANFKQVLKQWPLEILQQELIFLENHDEDPIALHVEWADTIPASLKPAALKAFSTLMILGVPGIPLLNSGQESGNRQRWMVTGHTWQYDKRTDWGRAPGAPSFEASEEFKAVGGWLDPFRDQSAEARDLREHFAQLLRIRSGNEAFWRGPGTRFLETDHRHAFASWRSAGNQRALVVVNLDPSSHDPSAKQRLFVDLSTLPLSAQERSAIHEELAKSRPEGGRFEQDLLMLEMAPYDSFVLEFSAGLEEPDFPPPAEMDRPIPYAFWEDGGRVYPSSRDSLGTVAFVSPENGRGGVGLYASLYKLDGLKDSEAIRSLFLLPDVPRYGTRPLYDTKPAGPAQEALRELREKVAAVLKKEGFEVMARVSGKPKRIPMIPLDIGGGEIRFGGWVPAQEEWIGDHTFTVEISWKGELYRLEEDGWFRIHRVGNGAVGSDGIPVPKKAKLWNSFWGPQVIGWNLPPPATGESPLDGVAVRPEADQDLWFKFWGGRYYLLSREEMGRYGFPFDAGRPDIPKGRPILEVRVRPGGILELPSLEIFEDPTLAARLEKSSELLMKDESVRKVAELVAQKGAGASSSRGAALAPTQEIIGRLEQVQSPEESRDLFLELDQAGWPRLGQQLRQGPAEERNRLVRLLSRSFHQWTQGDPEAPVVKRDNLGEAASHPSIRRGPPAIVFSPNGVLDLSVRPGKNGGIRQIEGHWAEGGGPLTVARAMGNIREGGPVTIVAIGAGDSGERLFENLERRGFHEVEPMADLGLAGNELVPIRAQGAGQRSRVNVNGLLSFGPKISLAELQQAIRAVLAKMANYGPGGTLVMGERLPDLDHPDGAKKAAGELADLAARARKLGWSVAVAASGSWTPETAGMILEARPSTIHMALEPFARWVNRDPRELLDQPEEVARLADQIRSRNQIERMIVSLGAGGEVFAGQTEWYHAVPSPVLELTYVTGERDVFLGVFTQFLQSGASEKEALHLAAVAGVLHMESWGRPVTNDQIQSNLHRARVYPLLESLLQPAKELLVVPLEELEDWPGKADLMELQKKRDSPFDGVYLWIQRERQFGPPVLHLGDFPALYSIRGTPEQVARYFDRREEKVRIHLPGTRQGPVLRRLLDQAGIAVREFSVGLEEGIAERFRMLVEGRTERGVLVVPDYMAAQSAGLRRFLTRMPEELAASVILWGEDPLLDRLKRRNPALQRFRGDLPALGLYLAEQQEADRVGILSDEEAVAVLAPRMKRMGISVTLVRWNISEILEILGDPQEVSSQVDLDALVGELFTERGT